MSNENNTTAVSNEALALLGLPSAPVADAIAPNTGHAIDEAMAAAPVNEQETAPVAETAASPEPSAPVSEPVKAAAAPFEIAGTEVFSAASLPKISRTVANRAPKYDFSDLDAPVDGDIKAKLFRLGSGERKQLSRSISSAVTQANKRTREAGLAAPFYSAYSHIDDAGNFVGMAVYRTDVDPK